MITLITGFIGMLLIVVFLGEYATTLDAIPLWIIIIGVLALAIADYVIAARQGDAPHQGGGQ